MKNRFNIFLQNNTVLSKKGVILAISPAYECLLQISLSTILSSQDLKCIYNNITNGTTSQTMIKSTPAKVGLCNYVDGCFEGISYGEQPSHVYYTYPYVPVYVSIAVVDLADNIVPGDVYARVVADKDRYSNIPGTNLSAANIIDSFYIGTATITYCIAQYFVFSYKRQSMVSYRTGEVVTIIILMALIITVMYHIVYFVPPLKRYCLRLHDVISRQLLNIAHGCQFSLRNLTGDYGQPNYGAAIQRSYNDSSYHEPLLSWRIQST